MYILMVAATYAELAQTMRWLDVDAVPGPGECVRIVRNSHNIDLLITGIGIHNTTYHLTRQLLRRRYDLVLQAGVGGSYDMSIPLGSVLRVETDLFADLGIEDHDRYLDLFETGLTDRNAPPFTNGVLPAPYSALSVLQGLPGASALTVNTVSGCARTIALRSEKYHCTVESMEGAALHAVCLGEQVPFVQIRAISNYVTPRDRSAWRMKDAIDNLNGFLRLFLETHFN